MPHHGIGTNEHRDTTGRDPGGLPRQTRRRRLTVVLAAAALTLTGLPAISDGASPAAAAPPEAPKADCPWVGSSAPIADRVSQVLGEMTLDEKISMVHGADTNGYTGRVAAIPRLCIPQLKLQDGPIGARMHDTTQLPSAVSLAASFDPELAHDYGSVVGAEMKSKGADVDLGPTVNIVRDPRWGRAFESYSEDPYLSAAIGSGTITGLQDKGIMAQVKHWAVYNQETNRNKPEDNAIIDNRTEREIYTKAFEDIVERAEPASAMCSYSSINGTYACENAELNEILKGQWGYAGFITSDWHGTHSTVGSANAGMDMQMPDATWFDDGLKLAVTNGTVPQARVDDMVSRILGQQFRFGLFEHPSPDTPDAVASTDEHVEFGRRAAGAGTVLLRNEQGALPLSTSGQDDAGQDPVKNIAVIGATAGKHTLSGGGGSASVPGTGTVTPFDGIKARAGKDATVEYAQGTTAGHGSLPAIETDVLQPAGGQGHGLKAEYFDNKELSGEPVVTKVDPQIDNAYRDDPLPGVPATNFSVRWSGTITAPKSGTYTFGTTSDDGARLKVDGKTVIDDWSNHGARTRTAEVDLAAGSTVDVQLEYYNAGSRGEITLGWIPPGVDLAQQAVDLAKKSDVAIVYSSVETTEGKDLADIDLPEADNDLIAKVAAANKRTIVVLNHRIGRDDALARPGAGRAGGLVSRSAERQCHRRCALRRRESVRQVAGHLPEVDGADADRGRRTLPRCGREGAVLREASGRLPLVRRAGPGTPVPVRIRALLHRLHTERPEAGGAAPHRGRHHHGDGEGDEHR